MGPVLRVVMFRIVTKSWVPDVTRFSYQSLLKSIEDLTTKFVL